MRIKQLALATLFGAAMALPALAQSTIAPARPAPVAPSAVAPGTIVPTAPKPTTSAPGSVTTPAAPTAAKTTAMVNINTATPAEIDALPGIGKARTAAIIKNRPYKAVDEIDTKKVIPHAVFEKIKALLTI